MNNIQIVPCTLDPTVLAGPTLYKRDTQGRIRVWFMEVQGGAYRTRTGIKGMTLTSTGWRKTDPKNEGKKNYRSAEDQALVEVEAHYKKKLKGEFHFKEADIDKQRWFKPMLAKTYIKDVKAEVFDEVFASGGVVISQPKLDGIRCIVDREGMTSRTGEPILTAPHIMEALSPVFEANPDLILDGELYNHDLKEDFNTILSTINRGKATSEDIEKSKQLIQLHIYDCPSASGGIADRLRHAIACVTQNPNMSTPIDWTAISSKDLIFVPTKTVESREELDELYGAYMDAGYEGQMIRDPAAAYQSKRTKALVKRKEREDAEFEIIRITEGHGNWAGAAKRVAFKLEDGSECGAGIAGKMEFCVDLWNNRHKYVGKAVTVEFSPRTPDGVPRFAVGKVFHLRPRM